MLAVAADEDKFVSGVEDDDSVEDGGIGGGVGGNRILRTFVRFNDLFIFIKSRTKPVFQ
jgi:hypothetical protein